MTTFLLAGLAFGIAIAASLARKAVYPSFNDWWQSEGIVIWLIAGMICGALLLG